MATDLQAQLELSLRDNATRPARQIQKSMGAIRREAKEATKAFQMAGPLRNAGIAAGAFAASAGFALKSVISPAIEFEKKMSKVAALSSASREEFEKQTEAAREMGRTTQFGASEAADALGQLAIGGQDVSEQLESLPTVLNLAKASGESLGRSADIVTDILGGFRLEASDTERVADVLTNTFTSTTTTLGTLFETMKFAGPVAKDFGLSIEQTATAAGLLGSAGIKGSKAGTALRAMMLRLVKPTDKAKKHFKDLNIEITDAEDNLRDPIKIFGEIAKATEEMGSGRRGTIIGEIFDTEAFTGASVLFNNLIEKTEEGASAFDELRKANENAGGRAEEVAKVMGENTAGGIKRFESALESLKITLGDTLLPSITAFLDKAAGVAQWFEDAAKIAPTLTKTVMGSAVAVTALAAVLSPLLLAGSAVANMWAWYTTRTVAATAATRAHATAAQSSNMAMNAQKGNLSALGMGMGSATKKTKKMAKAMKGLSVATKLAGAAFGGFVVGEMVDKALGEALGARGGSLGTEAGISAGESDVVNQTLKKAGEMFGIQSLQDVAQGNIKANENIRNAGVTGEVRGAREGSETMVDAARAVGQEQKVSLRLKVDQEGRVTGVEPEEGEDSVEVDLDNGPSMMLGGF